ncbi:hypothetical protein HDU89_000964 [Geranomyces variabilis]|nr:hypothetical protein HDU89_000964 [Geranomyces variabilis]
MYTLSYQVLPADQQVALYLVNGQETSLGFAPVITFASDPNGDAQIYLDFNITSSRPPSSYALNAWHRDYARWDDSRQDSFPNTSVHWMLAYGTGAEARINVQQPTPSPAFWDKKVGTFQMPYVIGAAGGGFLFAAFVGGFTWRRKMQRRAIRRVSSAAERGGAKMTDTGSNCHTTSRIPESQPSPREHAAIPNTDNIDQQVASTHPQQQQVVKEDDATSLREQDVEPRAPDMDEMSRGAVRCALSGAERGGAEMTNTGFNRHAADRIPESHPSLREHSAIHSKPNTDYVDQQVAFTDLQQQRYGCRAVNDPRNAAAELRDQPVSNQVAEFYCIKMALERVGAGTRTPVAIVTDSKYAIDCLTKWCKRYSALQLHCPLELVNFLGSARFSPVDTAASRVRVLDGYGGVPALVTVGARVLPGGQSRDVRIAPGAEFAMWTKGVFPDVKVVVCIASRTSNFREG